MILDPNNKQVFFIKDVEEQFRLYLFNPSFKHLFYGNWFPFSNTRSQRIRFRFELLKNRYKVYYLTDSSNEMIGMCASHRGGARYAFSTKKDIIIGPYVIKKEYRNKGMAKRLISNVLEQYGTNTRTYAWIKKNNEASIKTALSLGARQVGELGIKGVSHRLKRTEDSNTMFLLFEFSKSNKEE